MTINSPDPSRTSSSAAQTPHMRPAGKGEVHGILVRVLLAAEDVDQDWQGREGAPNTSDRKRCTGGYSQMARMPENDRCICSSRVLSPQRYP